MLSIAMYMHILWIECIVFAYCFFSSSQVEARELVVFGLLPFSGKHKHIGDSVKPVIEQAIQDVNSDGSILRGHQLAVEWVDSKVSIFLSSWQISAQCSKGSSHKRRVEKFAKLSAWLVSGQSFTNHHAA